MASREEVQKLFIRNSDRIEAFILGWFPDFTVSKDLLQEAFVVVTEKAAKFRTGTDFLAWARQIARNKVLQYLEKRERLPYLLDREVMETLEERQAALDDDWDSHRKALAECVKKLSPRARQFLKLRYSDETLTPRVIAQRVGWTPAAVRVHLSRTRASLYDCAQQSLNGGKA